MGTGAPAIRAFAARHFGISIDRRRQFETLPPLLDVDYPILSDPDGAVARAYGVLGPTGFPSRTTFFIGADGHILHIDRSVRPLSHGRDIVEKLEQLGIRRR